LKDHIQVIGQKQIQTKLLFLLNHRYEEFLNEGDHSKIDNPISIDQPL